MFLLPSSFLSFWFFALSTDYIIKENKREKCTTNNKATINHQPSPSSSSKHQQLNATALNTLQSIYNTMVQSTSIMKAFNFLFLAVSSSAFSFSNLGSNLRTPSSALHVTRDPLRMPTDTPMVPYKVRHDYINIIIIIILRHDCACFDFSCLID